MQKGSCGTPRPGPGLLILKNTNSEGDPAWQIEDRLLGGSSFLIGLRPWILVGSRADPLISACLD